MFVLIDFVCVCVCVHSSMYVCVFLYSYYHQKSLSSPLSNHQMEVPPSS